MKPGNGRSEGCGRKAKRGGDTLHTAHDAPLEVPDRSRAEPLHLHAAGAQAGAARARAKHQGGPFPWSVSCTCLSSALFTNSTESIAAPSRVRNCSTASFIDGGRSPSNQVPDSSLLRRLLSFARWRPRGKSLPRSCLYLDPLCPFNTHSTGTSAGAPLFLINNTRNFAGLVLLAFRSTT